MMMHKWFNPGYVIKIMDRMLRPLSVLTVLMMISGLYFALYGSPPDYQQGEAVRIMYIHVPAAWMGLLLYVIMALLGAAGLIWQNPLSFIMANAVAPIGAIFTTICLITGSLWGKPMWGSWWEWDARITSMLILLYFYVSYIILHHSFDDKNKGNKMAAILALLGVVNIPIIKFSVEWWHTLHQPASILRRGGISIDGSMLLPLLIMFGALMCYTGVMVIVRTKTAVMKKKAARYQDEHTL